MAQPVVQQPVLSSPPLSPSHSSLPSMIRTPSSEYNSKPTILSQATKKSLTESSIPQSSNRHISRSRPTSSKATSTTNGEISGSDNGVESHQQGRRGKQGQEGVEAAKDPTIAKAPGASFSVATKPQDRDPSLLRRPPQEKGFDGLSSYQLDHNGRIPANEFNYLQRDKLVASAQESAIRSGNLHWVALMDLAHLASQHHLSPYSMMKFGPRGSPFAYIPITLQQPDVVENTMLRQREEELQAKAWLIAKRERKMGTLPNGDVHMDGDDDLPVLSLPSDTFQSTKSQTNGSTTGSNAGTKRPASLSTPPDTRARSVLRTETEQVERELSEAMADPMDASSSQSPPMQVLPPSSREASSSEESDCVMPAKRDQVDPCTFDRSTRMVEIGSGFPQGKSANGMSEGKDSTPNGQAESGVADELMTSSQAGSNVEVGGPMDKERVMAQEMEQASATDKPAHPDGVPKDSSLGPLVHSEGTTSQASTTDEQQEQQQQQQHQLAMKTSDTHPIHISPILPDELLASVGHRLRSTAEPQLLRLDSASHSSSSAQQVTALSEQYFSTHSQSQVEGSRLIRLRNTLDLTSITATDPSANYLSQSELAEQAARETTLTLTSQSSSIGNLLLSSCPGKKVRLSGPVRGRGAICRDLGLDLTRIHSIGVRAVVCCLNDEELSYLGAPWSEYEREADRLGLDVYRLPMAEGFAPTNVVEMDAAMTTIVEECTLKGVNVLVHCRGGVGRAGLIACSWLLKMGFVGERSDSDESMLGTMDGIAGMVGNSREIVERTTSGKSHCGMLQDNESNKDGDNLYTSTTTATTCSRSSKSVEQGEMAESQEEAECDSILNTVRCLVETIRRRRSPKAIETAEQVRFLVEYVTYLHRQERLKAGYEKQNQ